MATKTQDQEQNESALKPIIFYQGEENGIVVETNDYEYSIFHDQYKRAFQIFERIRNQQLPYNELYKECGEKVVSPLSIEVDNQYSNIVAFCGDRGEGKSSCMSSFAAMLSKEGARAAAIKADLVNDKYVSSNNIELVDTIDPSSFDSTHNIIELLVGRMFFHIKKECFKQDDCGRSQYDYDQRLCKRSSLLKQFEKVKSSMAILNNKEIKYDSMEEVDDLAVGLRLKNEIEELFKQYLDYKGKKLLVLCIDDLDLNMIEGYRMAEMMRKYLVNPYCILLVAVKVDQLVNVIATAIEQETKGSQIITDIQCHHMAQKYVVKLLPQSNRVEMPSPMDFCNRTFLFKTTRSNESAVAKANVLMKDFIVRLIYQKTRYVFYNGLELSPIVPRNLRELRHLIAKLYNQEDAWLDDETESNHGREAFHEYFFETWAEKLPNEDYEFAQTLLEYENVTTLNKYILDYFVTRVEKVDGVAVNNLGEEENKLYQRICNRNNVAANISFGDVMYVLQTIDKITTNQDIRNLIFLLKTYYHIRLYALYNQITESEDALFATDGESKGERGVRIYRNDHIFDGVNALQRLLNGAVFSYPEGCFLPKEKGKKSRDKRHISFDAVKDAFAALRNLTGDEYTKQLRLCEYLALCISGTITSDVRNKLDSVDFDRQSMEVPYLGKFSTSRHIAIFDFLYPFYSLCNIKYTYGRFDEILKGDKEHKDILYNLALENKDSILRTLLDYVENARRVRLSQCDLYIKDVEIEEKLRWRVLHSLVSDAIIRVTDVQWAISDYLSFTKDVHKVKDETNCVNIRKAYRDIQKINIKIYSVEHNLNETDLDEDLWRLHFDFLSILCNVLGDSVKDSFLHHGIYLSDNIESNLAKIFQEEIIDGDDDEGKYERMFMNSVESLLGINFPQSAYPTTGNTIKRLLLQRVPKQYSDKLAIVFDLALQPRRVFHNNKELINALAYFAVDIAKVYNSQPTQQADQSVKVLGVAAEKNRKAEASQKIKKPVKGERDETKETNVVTQEQLKQLIWDKRKASTIVTALHGVLSDQQIEELQIEDSEDLHALKQRILDKYGEKK